MKYKNLICVEIKLYYGYSLTKGIEMKKIISLGLALGCIGVSAAANNYDLLGRKGSQMNSPMVYKNVDYLKEKKNESRNFALMKTGTGLRNNVYALEGRYFSQGWGGSYYYTSKPGKRQERERFFFTKSQNSVGCSGSSS